MVFVLEFLNICFLFLFCKFHVELCLSYSMYKTWPMTSAYSLLIVPCFQQYLERGRVYPQKIIYRKGCARCVGINGNPCWTWQVNIILARTRLDAKCTFVYSALPLPNSIFIFSFPPTPFLPLSIYSIFFLFPTGWSIRILEFQNVRVGRDLKITCWTCLTQCQETKAIGSLVTNQGYQFHSGKALELEGN